MSWAEHADTMSAQAPGGLDLYSCPQDTSGFTPHFQMFLEAPREKGLVTEASHGVCTEALTSHKGAGSVHGSWLRAQAEKNEVAVELECC